jgi:hypothetical protein
MEEIANEKAKSSPENNKWKENKKTINWLFKFETSKECE